MQYFSTFITGLHEVVEGIIRDSVPGVRIKEVFDGAVLFETPISINKIGLHCLNNIFEVIDFMSFQGQKQKESKSPIELHMKKLLAEKKRISPVKCKLINDAKLQGKNFRIVTSHENRLVSVNGDLKRGLEGFIKENSGLALDRSNAEVEFWFLYRDEGYCFFMKRLTKHTAYEKILHKGELRPELAYMLNVISQPSKADVVVDFFCGYGSIPVQRALHFEAKAIYAFDIDRSLIDGLIASKAGNGKIVFKCADALRLEPETAESGVDKIVTDPPWGIYEAGKLSVDNIAVFYEKMLGKFAYVMKRGGIAVILTARNDEIRETIISNASFIMDKEYQILVSGKKSTIYKLIKR